MTRMQRQQRGIVAVLVAIGLLALLAMAGLAIDTGHLVLNKSRLQSTVDAAALAAAKVLDQTGSQTQATAAADSLFDINSAELSGVVSSPSITVRFSNTLNPFAEGSTPANYVRVRADGFSMWTSFTALVGFDELPTGASAVAGPSAPIPCPELVPMTVCADMTHPPDPDVPDPSSYWGIAKESLTILKSAAPPRTPIGPGNFQVIDLGGQGGGMNDAREYLAGGFHSCVGDTVLTEPGMGAGPVSDGLNTRLGCGQKGNEKCGPLNPADYPPDKIRSMPTGANELWTDDGIVVRVGGRNGTVVTPENYSSVVTYTYADYVTDSKKESVASQPGEWRRRILALPIANCSNSTGGKQQLPRVGVGCFFLLQ